MPVEVAELVTESPRAIREEQRMQEDDLERIFAHYLDPVYRFLYTRVGNREDAEDLTSHVFLKASQQLDSGRTEASVASWLFTVARTVLADHWRRYYRSPTPAPLDEEIASTQLHDDGAGDPSRVTEQLVEMVLEALPARYRQVLELRFLQGYSVDEAAEAMGVTRGNLKVLQHRALARAADIGLETYTAERSHISRPTEPGGTVTMHELELRAPGALNQVRQRKAI